MFFFLSDALAKLFFGRIMSALSNLQASVDAVGLSANAAVAKIDELKALVAAGGTPDAELDAVAAKVDAVAAQLAAAVS